MTAVSFSSSAVGRTHRPLTSPGVIDAAFVVGLGALGLVGFHSLYGGVAYLLVGLLGIVLGVAVTEVARRWGQPVLAEAFVTLVAFILLGGAVAAPKSALGGLLPTGSTLRVLGHVGIYGWKELLTTAPPVGNSSDLLAIPYIVGLVGGVAGQSVARRTRLAALPLAGPALILALGILFGARHPASLALQGSLFGVAALSWMAIRHHRHRTVLTARRLGLDRLLPAVGLLVITGLAAGVVGPLLPGSGTSRVVLSRYVVPPFEANQQPSPLAAFRNYATGGVFNQEVLFSVKGAPTGSLVRIATMDEYDGIVWGFGAASGTRAAGPSDAFQRYGTSIPAAVTGPVQHLTVTIGSLRGVWVPEVGQATRISFSGAAADRLTAGFRYDPATSTAAEPGGLSSGDRYKLVSVDAGRPSGPQLQKAAAGDVTMDLTGVPTVLQSDASAWTSGATSAWGKVMAIATHFRTVGYYSDGFDPSAPGDPMISAPGHGAGRLETFLRGGPLVGTEIVGDDEQYAATLALMADSVGVPARVVLGGQLEASGVVRGRDVHAWVEVSLAGLGWVTVTAGTFVPTRPAHLTPPTQAPQASSAAPVEPPVVSAIHSPIGDQLPGNSTDAASNFAHPKKAPGFSIPAWVKTVIWILLVPIVVTVGLYGLVVGFKRRRRTRRRRAATTTSQIAGAWSELIDRARDLGHVVPAGRTRREQAALLTAPEAGGLASRADAAIFAPGDASESQAADYWAEIDRFSARMMSELGRWQRWRARASLRSLRWAEARRGLV